MRWACSQNTSVKWSVKRVKKKIEFCHYSSVDVNLIFILLLSLFHHQHLIILHLEPFTLSTQYLLLSSPVGPPSVWDQRLFSLGNFLLEQKPEDTKPRCEMHQRFLGLGGELWEQSANKTNTQIKPFRWLSLSKHIKVANIFASWAPNETFLR